jgi:hypothetical protein
MQPRGDVGIRQAARQQAQHLAFTGAELAD